MNNRSLTAVTMAALLVLTAFGSMPVVAQEASLEVETLEPTNVTITSAELRGNLTSLESGDSADVWFAYWVEGDPANTTETQNVTVTETGEFEADVGDLESNTTYVVVAHAENEATTVGGDQVTFTTDEEEGDAADAFGQEVVAELNRIMKGLGIDSNEPLGQQLSAWVLENNPANDHRPDHARGGDAGPPSHAGPPDDDDGSEDDDETDDGTEN